MNLKYMLILGGRYGIVDPLTGKSYTQLEYKYVVSKGETFVLKDSYIKEKSAIYPEIELVETTYKKDYYILKKHFFLNL